MPGAPPPGQYVADRGGAAELRNQALAAGPGAGPNIADIIRQVNAERQPQAVPPPSYLGPQPGFQPGFGIPIMPNPTGYDPRFPSWGGNINMPPPWAQPPFMGSGRYGYGGGFGPAFGGQDSRMLTQLAGALGGDRGQIQPYNWGIAGR